MSGLIKLTCKFLINFHFRSKGDQVLVTFLKVYTSLLLHYTKYEYEITNIPNESKRISGCRQNHIILNS